MKTIRGSHVSPGVYFRETNKTNKVIKPFVSPSLSSAHTPKSSKPQGGGGGGTPTPPVPPPCTESSSYTISNVSYPRTVEFSATSNIISFDYTVSIINGRCETSTINGSDSVTIQFEVNGTDEPKTISGSIEYHGNAINYEFIQMGHNVEPQYRWVKSGAECVDHDLYEVEMEQVSYDSGITWNDTFETRYGELLEEQSSECGGEVDYSKQYLTFIALEDLGFGFTYDTTHHVTGISYSLDNGNTWIERTNPYEYYNSINVDKGKKVMWKGELTTHHYGSHGIGTFGSSGKYYVEGNVMSLLYGDDFEGKTSLDRANSFSGLFSGSTQLISAENMILPATILTDGCYGNMFQGCVSLTTAPLELPATTLADGCYISMFIGCTSLTTPPKLPATTLANGCYFMMFDGCTSLVTAPQLLATTLAENCYNGMFDGCTSLVTAPQLLATILEYHCYHSMFQGCTSLTIAPQLPATTLADGCYIQMFNGCTSLVTAPQLPATTLAENCYNHMFQNCTSLTTAPELLATTLVNQCYQGMFNNCSHLNYIKAMFTTIPSASYTYYWVNRVASNGTFVKNDAATWTSSCGIDTYPCGWTVETASA